MVEPELVLGCLEAGPRSKPIEGETEHGAERPGAGAAPVPKAGPPRTKPGLIDAALGDLDLDPHVAGAVDPILAGAVGHASPQAGGAGQGAAASS